MLLPLPAEVSRDMHAHLSGKQGYGSQQFSPGPCAVLGPCEAAAPRHQCPASPGAASCTCTLNVTPSCALSLHMHADRGELGRACLHAGALVLAQSADHVAHKHAHSQMHASSRMQARMQAHTQAGSGEHLFWSCSSVPSCSMRLVRARSASAKALLTALRRAASLTLGGGSVVLHSRCCMLGAAECPAASAITQSVAQLEKVTRRACFGKRSTIAKHIMHTRAEEQACTLSQTCSTMR